MTQFPKFHSFNISSFPEQLQLQLQHNLHRIEQLLATQQTWTWNNLIEPLEVMEDDVERLWSPISHLHAVMNQPELRHCYQTCLPILTHYQITIGHNKILCDAVQSIDTASLSATQCKVIQDMLLNFKLAGVFLTENEQKHFESIQESLATLSNQFETNVLDSEDQYEFWVEDVQQLSGLPPHTIQTALDTAKAKKRHGWCLTLAYPCYLAVLTYAEDSALREVLYYAYQTRAAEIGPHDKSLDNSPIINRILELRTEEAQLLKFLNYSECSLATKMAASPEVVIDFLQDLAARVIQEARKEFQALQDYARSVCHIEHIAPWDIAYVSQKMKQALFSVSDEALRPYFPLHHVLEEIRKLLYTLFGISFQKINLETWHQDVECYEIIDEHHVTRGYLYLDLFARPNKRNGAWMDSLQSRRQRPDGHIQYPIATLTCNFAKPMANHPPTLTHEEVITLLHELGHCLHHTLTLIETHSATGIHGVEWDAVELPSQFLENWGWEKGVLKTLSAHVDTHQSLPEEIITQLINSKNFQSALGLMRQIEFSRFDFELHQTTHSTLDRVEKTLNEVRQHTSVVPTASFNRFQNSFSHIFSGGYAAGYYSYLWAEVLSSDAFARFQEEGLINEKIGRDFLHCILEVGGSRKANDSFICFRGRTPRIDALLKSYGIMS